MSRDVYSGHESNMLFTLRSVSISDKEFRGVIDGPTVGLICQIYFRVIQFSEFKLLLLVLSDERVFSLKDTS